MINFSRFIFIVIFTVILSAKIYGAELTVVVSGIEPARSGNICLVVWSDEKSGRFLDGDWRSAAVCKLAILDEQELQLKLKPGLYAALAFHDEDSDESCNCGVFGNEEFSILGDPAPGWFPPAFKDVMFELTEKGSSGSIALEY